MRLIAVWACLAALGAGSLLGQNYISPYAITLTNVITSWTTDFPARS
jgi:hypothetical protein